MLLEKILNIFAKLISRFMSIISLMIIVSLIIALVFLFLFLKTVKSGQYDDLHSPAVRMLFEDELIEPKQNESKKTKTKK